MFLKMQIFISFFIFKILTEQNIFFRGSILLKKKYSIINKIHNSFPNKLPLRLVAHLNALVWNLAGKVRRKDILGDIKKKS